MARPKKKKAVKNTVPNQIAELENAIAEVRGTAAAYRFRSAAQSRTTQVPEVHDKHRSR
jgi:hypothetical protein